MKTRRAVLNLLLLPSASLLLAAVAAPAPPTDDVLPKATPIASYTDLINNSPFSPPSAPIPTATPLPPPKDDWAKSITASSAVQIKGIFSVTLTDRDTNERFLVTSDPKDSSTNPRGITLVSVQWSDIPSQTRLTLRRGDGPGAPFAEKTLEGAAGGAPGLAPAMPMTPPGGMGARPLPTPVPMIRPAGTAGAGGFPAPPPSSPSMIRRPIIRANPAPTMQAAPPLPGSTLGRPPVNPAAGRAGAVPQTPADDDDDDDDGDN